MTYTPLPNPWTGIPLVGSLIDAIQNQLASTTSPITGSSLTIGDTTQGNEHIDPTNGYREFYMAEAYPRIQLSRDGYSSGVAALGFGPGNVAPDTKLFRSAAGVLKTAGSLEVMQNLVLRDDSGTYKLYFGAAADTYIYRSAAGSLNIESGTVTNLRINGPSLPRWIINNTGNGANLKKWQSYLDTSGTLVFGALNDAENAQTIALTLNRSGSLSTGAINISDHDTSSGGNNAFVRLHNTVAAANDAYFWQSDTGHMYLGFFGGANVLDINPTTYDLNIGHGGVQNFMHSTGNAMFVMNPNYGGAGAPGFVLYNSSSVEKARYYTDGSNLIIKATGGTMQLSDSAGGGGIYAGGMRVHRHPYGNDRHIESGGYLWGGGGSISITFTSAYAAAPIVVIGGEGEALYAQSITTTGFTFGAGSSGHSYWLAEGN